MTFLYCDGISASLSSVIADAGASSPPPAASSSVCLSASLAPRSLTSPILAAASSSILLCIAAGLGSETGTSTSPPLMTSACIYQTLSPFASRVRTHPSAFAT